jgi:hypothetical protein
MYMQQKGTPDNGRELGALQKASQEPKKIKSRSFKWSNDVGRTKFLKVGFLKHKSLPIKYNLTPESLNIDRVAFESGLKKSE